MVLPVSPELHGTPHWGVVLEPTLRVYAGPDRSQRIVAVLRRGDMLQLAERHSGDAASPDARGLWYRLVLPSPAEGAGAAGQPAGQPEPLSGLAADQTVTCWIEGEGIELLAFELQARERHRQLKAEQAP